jgi:hypothetical protein
VVITGTDPCPQQDHRVAARQACRRTRRP